MMYLFIIVIAAITFQHGKSLEIGYSNRWEINGVNDDFITIALKNHSDVNIELCEFEAAKIEPTIVLFCTNFLYSNSSEISLTGPFSSTENYWTLPIPDVCKTNSTIRIRVGGEVVGSVNVQPLPEMFFPMFMSSFKHATATSGQQIAGLTPLTTYGIDTWTRFNGKSGINLLGIATVSNSNNVAQISLFTSMDGFLTTAPMLNISFPGFPFPVIPFMVGDNSLLSNVKIFAGLTHESNNPDLFLEVWDAANTTLYSCSVMITSDGNSATEWTLVNVISNEAPSYKFTSSIDDAVVYNITVNQDSTLVIINETQFILCEGFSHQNDIDVTMSSYRDGFVISSRSRANVCVIKMTTLDESFIPIDNAINDAVVYNCTVHQHSTRVIINQTQFIPCEGFVRQQNVADPMITLDELFFPLSTILNPEVPFEEDLGVLMKPDGSIIVLRATPSAQTLIIVQTSFAYLQLETQGIASEYMFEVFTVDAVETETNRIVKIVFNSNIVNIITTNGADVVVLNNSWKIQLENDIDTTNCLMVSIIGAGEQRSNLSQNVDPFTWSTYQPTNVYSYDINFKRADRQQDYGGNALAVEQGYLADINTNITHFPTTKIASNMSAPGTIFLSNWERYTLNITVQGTPGHEEELEGINIFASLHQSMKSLLSIETVEQHAHRNTEKRFLLTVGSSNTNRVLPGSEGSESTMDVMLQSQNPSTCFKKMNKDMQSSSGQLEQNIETGCPRNRELIFDLNHHLSTKIGDTTDSDLKKVCGEDYASFELDYWKKPYCHIPFVEYEKTFSPKFAIRNTITNEIRSFDGDYHLTVLNGEWLRIDDENDKLLVPNFLPIDECEQLNKNLDHANYTFNCLNGTNDTKFNDAVGNLIWYDPLGTGRNSMKMSFKKNGPCSRSIFAMPLLLLSSSDSIDGYYPTTIFPPEYYLHVQVTNTVPNVTDGVHPQSQPNNCLLSTTLTVRVGIIPIDEYDRLWLAFFFFGGLLFLIIIYVLILTHENTIQNMVDNINECYNRKEIQKQQELFDAQYTRKMQTLVSRSKASVSKSIGNTKSRLGAALHRPSISVRRESVMSQRISAIPMSNPNAGKQRNSLFVNNM